MTHRRFRLLRYVDISEVSGTGDVAEGIQYSDGAVALRWRGKHPCTSTWNCLDDLLAVHGHGGSTVVDRLDPEPPAAELELADAASFAGPSA